jgi:pimeloyl-ACP methyl ester carboxylesterase
LKVNVPFKSPRPPVVVVHGLWLNGFETFLLRERLVRAGFAPTPFRYPSTNASLEEVTAALAQRLRMFSGPVHLVAHSLGGLITLEALATERDLPPGRIVLLGSPVQGSRAARAVASWSLGAQILGALAVSQLTCAPGRSWNLEREVGLIAGSRSAGVGRFLVDLPEPNDGTVAVDETRLSGAAGHRVLDVSHIGMLFSAAVAESAVEFLTSGSFGRA